MKLACVVSCSDSVKCEAEYSLSYCLSSLGFFSAPYTSDSQGTLLCYGEIPEEVMERVLKGDWVVNILHDPGGFEGMVNGKDLPRAKSRGAGGSGPVAVFFVCEEKEGVSLREMVVADGSKLTLVSEERMGEGGVITVHFDLLASIFFFLSRAEEVFSNKTDEFERPPQELAICAREGFEEEPVVNTYILLVQELLILAAHRSSRMLLRKLEWPAGQGYCVSLTHDVDRLAKWRGRSILKGILTGKTREVFSSVRKSKSDPWWNLDHICETEKKIGVRSTFYFFTDRGGEHGGRYDCVSIKELLRDLVDGGWEIGLHGSYASMTDKSRLIKEKMRLGEAAQTDIAGVRQHYLRVKIPETIENMEIAGFSYDASVGFSDRVGFRASMCLPYHLYDFENRKAFDILEIPISIMDRGLPGDVKRRKQEARRIVQSVKEGRGVLSLLWHQSMFDDADFPGLGLLYEWLLDMVSADNPFFANHVELYRWWRKRGQVSIVSSEEKGAGTVLRIVSGEEIPLMSFEVFGRVSGVSCEGATLKEFCLKEGDRSVFTICDIRSPGFGLSIEHGDES